MGPLTRVDELLPAHIRRVTERETPIPTFAQRAAQAVSAGTPLVRCDIGQIVGVRPEDEVLYGPPLGLDATRDAVAELYNHSFALAEPVSADNVAICTGAAEALSILFRCFAHEQRVGLPRGHWENYLNGVEMAAGSAEIVDFFAEDGSFAPERLAAQIHDKKLAVIVTNFPCNPTGAVLDGDETAALARVVKAANVVVIADEVYARLRYDDQPPQTLLGHAPEHAISLGSASKEYLLPGARVGYVVARNADITKRILRRMIRASSASPNVPGQRLLLERLEPDLALMRQGKPPALLHSIRDRMRERRDALLAVLARHDMAPPGRTPSGTIFAMASLPSWWEGDDHAFCERALEEGLFSSIPGSAFGLPGTFRLSYGALTLEQVKTLDEHIAELRRRCAS